MLHRGLPDPDSRNRTPYLIAIYTSHRYGSDRNGKKPGWCACDANLPDRTRFMTSEGRAYADSRKLSTGQQRTGPKCFNCNYRNYSRDCTKGQNHRQNLYRERPVSPACGLNATFVDIVQTAAAQPRLKPQADSRTMALRPAIPGSMDRPQTTPNASIASATFLKPAMFAPRT